MPLNSPVPLSIMYHTRIFILPGMCGSLRRRQLLAFKSIVTYPPKAHPYIYLLLLTDTRDKLCRRACIRILCIAD